MRHTKAVLAPVRMGGEAEAAAAVAADVSSARRWFTYWLVSIHSLTVYITRGCIPFIVPCPWGWRHGKGGPSVPLRTPPPHTLPR